MTEHLRDMEERLRNSNILPIEAVHDKVRNRENKRKEGGKEVLRTEKSYMVNYTLKTQQENKK